MNIRSGTRKALTVVLVVSLVSSIAIAGTTLSTYEDGPAQSSQWSQSTYSGDLAQDNYNSSTSEVQLNLYDVSESEGGFGDTVNGHSDLAETSSDIHLKRGSSEGDRNFGVGEISESRTMADSAYANNHMFFLGDYLHSAFDGGYTTQKCDVASNTVGQPRGLARNPGGGAQYEFIVLARDGARGSSNIYEFDLDDCSTNKAFTYAGFGVDRGIALHESDNSKIYATDGYDNEIDVIDLESGSHTVGVTNLPNGDQHGLDVHQWPDGTVWFIVSYSGNNGEEELQIIRKSDGSVIKTFTSNNGQTWAPVWNHDADQKRVFVTDGNNYMDHITLVNLWKGDGQGNAKYQNSLGDVPENNLKTLTWQGEAPGTFKGTSGQLELQAKDKNGNWQTLDTQSRGTGSFSNSITLGSDFTGISELTYRVRFGNNYKIRGGASNPKVTDVSWDYEYYGSQGTVSSTTVDTSKVENFQNLTVNGTSGGNEVTVRVLDKEGNVEYENSSVQPNQTLNLSSVPEDYSTQEVTMELELQSSGLSSPGLTGYNARWMSATEPPPGITDYYAEAGSTNTTSTELDTGIGSEDQFVLQDVNDTIDSVQWYVNGEMVTSSNVSSDGPFTFNKTWDSTGTYTVVGEVENSSSGIDYVEWTVDVYDIAIQGEDSYTKSSGDLITTTQTFETFTVDDASIDFEVTYNESVVRLISGPESGTVTNGGSRTWEFQVQESNYTGNPITIVAHYGEKTTTKQIHVSSASSGGIIGTGDDGLSLELLTNTWVGGLLDLLGIFDDHSSQVYLVVQGILAGGFALAIWLHHFGLIWLPRSLDRRLKKTGRVTKGFVTVIGGTLVLGVNLIIWTLTTGVLVFAYLRYVGTNRTPVGDIKGAYEVVKSV